MFTGVQDIRTTTEWFVPGQERQRQIEDARIDQETAEAEAKEALRAAVNRRPLS
jgi:hypothetical protein